MELVLAHRNMDFDCLASQLAVTKLLPKVRMVPAHPLPEGIRSFLALYRDNLPMVDLQYVDKEKVSHVYIVDCQKIERLDERAKDFVSSKLPALTYTVFDHHEYDPEGLVPTAREDSICKSTGAATTILVEKLREANVQITPFEATVMTAGIYEDTGCLTHRGTIELDVTCVAWLLSKGADLSVVKKLIKPVFSDEQSELFEDLLSKIERISIPGLRATICSGQTPHYVEGLADITSRIVSYTASDAVVSAVKMKDRVHVVGRCESPLIDMSSLMKNFGGGGHPGAASAVIKNGDTNEIVKQVKTFLKTQTKPEKTAAEIMESPVRTILPDVSMEEAFRIMLRHSLDGLIVMDQGNLVGVISKRDVDKARHHKLGHAPARGFMSHPVITVTEHTSLSEMQKIMVREDIGRLPVLNSQSKLIGIVGRKSLLSALYGKTTGEDQQEESVVPVMRVRDVRSLLSAVEADILELYKELGVVAAALGMTAYLVGGCVRDLILRRDNYDLDFVVEGSAIDLARELCRRAPTRFEVLAEHARFNTATLRVKSPRGRDIDIASARTEYYEFPAALPVVEPSRLEQDLSRRDFSINALAMSLHPDSFGRIIDFYNGMSDIEAKLIRVLHPFSFIEDPTRIIRAARFASRFSFSLERKTKLQAQRAIELGIFDNLGGVRLKEEIRMILESPERLVALDILKEAGGGLRFLDAHVHYDRHLRLHVRRAERLLRDVALDKIWIVYLGLLLSGLDPTRLVETLNRLQLSEDEKKSILDARTVFHDLMRLEPGAKRSDIYNVLHGYEDSSLAIAASQAPTGAAARRHIKLYLDKLRSLRPTITGKELKELGLPEGKALGKLLTELKQAIIDGHVKNPEDEKKFVLQRLQTALEEDKALMRKRSADSSIVSE